jgi:hypothetical protein
MRLYRHAEVPGGTQGLCCRQSRLAGGVRFIVWTGMLAMAPILGWHFGQPWVTWIGAAVALLVAPLMLMDLVALFRATNWLMRIGTDGVWINLCSYRDKAPEAASVLRLDYGEVASAGRHTESYSTPSEPTGPMRRGAVGSTTIWTDQFLEIRLNHEQTDELKAVLDNLRYPASSGQRSSGQVQVRNRYFPIWLVSPDVLRVAWVSGHGHAVAPPLGRALGRLDTYVRVAAPSRRERPEWRELTADEVDELARELVHVHGATIEATSLLVRARGMTHAEATALVQQLDAGEAR